MCAMTDPCLGCEVYSKWLRKSKAPMKPKCSECFYFTHQSAYPKYRCSVEGRCPAYDRWEDIDDTKSKMKEE